MGNRIAVILFVLLLAVPCQAKIYLGTGAGWSEVTAMSTGSGADRVTPQIWNDNDWFAFLTYGPEYFFVVGLGQSNMVGNPPAYEPELFPVITHEGFEIKTNETYNDPFEEPSGNNDTPFDYSGQAGGVNYTGSMVGSIIKNLHEETGSTVIVLTLGANATTSTEWINTIDALAEDRITDAMTQLGTDGYDFGNKIHFVWLQGESDQGTVEEYASRLTTIITYFVDQFPAYDLTFHLCYPAFFAFMGAGMDIVATNRADTVIASDYTTSVIHFSMTELNAIGADVATSIEVNQ